MHVKLESVSGGTVIYDDFEKAVEALNDLGLCLNDAVVFFKGEADKRGYLLYHGYTFRYTPERSVCLPFDVNSGFAYSFQLLLEAIFKPFIAIRGLTPSLISVIQTVNPLRAPGDACTEKECYSVTLLFPLENGQAYKAQRSLSKVEDSHEEISGIYFCLD